MTPLGYNTGGMHMFTFTEQVVSMLVTVFRSKNATEISIAIMRACETMRRRESQICKGSVRVGPFLCSERAMCYYVGERFP